MDKNRNDDVDGEYLLVEKNEMKRRSWLDSFNIHKGCA